MHHTHTRTYTQMEKETREKENGSLTTRAPRELSLLLRGGLRHSVKKLRQQEDVLAVSQRQAVRWLAAGQAFLSFPAVIF